jgi:hypothetical protein
MQCDCFSYHRMYHNNWQLCSFDISCVVYSMCVVLFKIFVIRFFNSIFSGCLSLDLIPSYG